MTASLPQPSAADDFDRPTSLPARFQYLAQGNRSSTVANLPSPSSVGWWRLTLLSTAATIYLFNINLVQEYTKKEKKLQWLLLLQRLIFHWARLPQTKALASFRLESIYAAWNVTYMYIKRYALFSTCVGDKCAVPVDLRLLSQSLRTFGHKLKHYLFVNEPWAHLRFLKVCAIQIFSLLLLLLWRLLFCK